MVEAHLSITGEFEFARVRAVIHNRRRTDFGVCFRDDAYGPTRFKIAVSAVEFNHIRVKGEFIFVGGHAERLPADRPNGAVRFVPHIAELAPTVARDVFTPASDVEAPIGAGTRPRV